MKKPDSNSPIQHEGRVIKVDNGSVLVSISTHSACSGCHAEGICGISGKEEKFVDVMGKYNVLPGDSVTVLMKQASGSKAVILSYLVPLVIVITCLIIFSLLSINELAAGLVSIIMLMPYFLILYLFRKKINRSFTFTLKQ